MKYKGKEIKKYLMENVALINPLDPRDMLYLGTTGISETELRKMYGSDISNDDLIKKGKDYLVESVLDRYTVTLRAEPGVKAMYCKVRAVGLGGVSSITDTRPQPFSTISIEGINENFDLFIPIFTCISIPRHSVIYTSNDDTGKRRASAGKITNILWYPTGTNVGCLIIPKRSALHDRSERVCVKLIPDRNYDNQVMMVIKGGYAGGNLVRIELDDYNPKTKTTDTVYSMYEIEKYASHISLISQFPKDYIPFARHIGYSVKIDDFDITPCTCSTGFHFFDSIDEAQNYISM